MTRILIPALTVHRSHGNAGLYDLNVEESCERAALSAGLGLMTELIRQRDGETTQVAGPKSRFDPVSGSEPNWPAGDHRSTVLGVALVRVLVW